jgi:hypothetical protein
MLIYTGRIELADETQYFDATGNLALHGQMLQDISLWQPGSEPNDFAMTAPTPLRPLNAEPGLMLAAAPLYRLAEALPALGLGHTVYLFNALVAPLVGVLFYGLGRAMGFGERAALLGALCLGLLTILLPYSQTFFREPLMMAFMLAAAILLERLRRPGIARAQRAVLAGGALIFLGLAFFTKEAVVLGLPGMLLLALPDRIWAARIVRRVALVALIALLLAPVLLAYTEVMRLIAGLLPDVAFFGRFALETDETQLVTRVFVFSVGGSLWGTSPILLLSIPGAWRLWRRGQERVVLGALTVALGYCLGYALFRGESWHGGTIWPQRFLLPALPFALLPALAMLEPGALARRWARVGRALIGLLIAYSAWWQFSGASYRWEMYSQATFQESFGLIHWLPGYFDPRYLRPVALTQFWGREELNFAWVRTDTLWWPLAFGAVLLASLWALRRAGARWALALPGVVVALMAVAVLDIGRRDELYLASRSDLFALVEAARSRAAPGDAIIISDPQDRPFYFNHGKFGPVWTPILDYHPGERGSCDQPLEIVSDNPAALLSERSIQAMTHFALTREYLWLIVGSGPEVPCVVRPVERYLGAHYYRLGETRASPIARLVLFAAIPAPDPFGFVGPETLTDFRFTFTGETGDEAAESVNLLGYTLPRGSQFRPGEVLPLSLAWRVDTTPTRDFTVAWFLADDAGAVVAQGEDTWPGATFAPTTLMRLGVTAWDHRALRLPESLPPGEYALWVRLYWLSPATGAPEPLRVTGGPTAGDADLAVLPARVMVGQ